MTDYEKIVARIAELEAMKETMDEAASAKRLELAAIRAQAAEMEGAISVNIFENRDEARELRELKVAKRWMDVYNGSAGGGGENE